MATGFPTKANWVSGDILTAAQMDDLAGTVNALSNAAATSGSVLVSNVAGTSFAYQPLQAAGKNAIINGGMDIWQRGISFSSPANGSFISDRWCTNPGTSTNTYSRQITNDTTNLPNIQYCARVQRNAGQTGASAIFYFNSFETVNSIPFAGKTATFSFYARAGANYSATSGNLQGIFNSGTGTDQNYINVAITGQAGVASINATLTTTWQRFTVSGTVPATATELQVGFIFTPVGTAGVNDYFEVTGVQVELGSVATTFSRAGGTLQGELAACQRYYYRTNAQTFGSGMAFSSTQGLCWTTFPVTMRTAPTALEQSGTATDYNFLNSVATGVNLSAVPTFGAAYTQSSQTSITVASGLTAGNASKLAANNANAYLGWSAEL